MMTPQDESTLQAAPKVEKKRQKSVVIPAIPRQYARARPNKKGSIVEVEAQEKRKSGRTAEINGTPEKEIFGGMDKEGATAEPQTTLAAALEPNGRAQTTPDVAVAAEEPLESPKDVLAVQNSVYTSTVTTDNDRPALPHFNMKELASELPPPFYPAYLSQASSSVRLPRDTSQQSAPPANAIVHPPPHNADGLVFGGFGESSNASPRPTTSAGSTFFPSQSPAFPHDGSQPPPFSPVGQDYSFAGTYGPLLAMQMSPHDSQDGFHPSAPPHQPMHTSLPQRSSFGGPPGLQCPTHINGHAQPSRSNSQVSANTSDPADVHRTQFNVSRQSVSSVLAGPEANSTAYESHKPALHGPPSRRDPGMYPPRFDGFPQRVSEPDNKNISHIAEHLRIQFGSFEFADYIVEIADEQAILHTVPCHGLILARSPRFQSMMRSNSTEVLSGSPKTLHLPKQFYFRKPDALIEAMRFLYGGSLPDEGRFIHSSLVAVQQQQDPRVAREMLEDQMAYILSYTAAGCLMGMPELVFRGLQIANRLLRWESLETALSFALAGGLGQVWRDEYSLDDRGSSTSSEDSFTRVGNNAEPVYDPHATQFLHHIVGFICFNFPRDFVLDTSAPQLPSVPRLPKPSVHGSRPSISDPRLKSIRFGEAPADENKSAHPGASILSSVLFSIPFPILKATLEHPMLGEMLGWHVVPLLIEHVIQERERRRIQALKAYTVARSTSEFANDGLVVQNFFWEEAVEPSPQHRCGLKLVRRRKGIDTPPSSTSTASK